MKKIVKQIPAKTVVHYQCEVCGNKYNNADKAKECEQRVAEEKKFSVGQEVRALEPRGCFRIEKPLYRVQGKVVDISDPLCPDFEYEVKWLGGRRINWHVFQYTVEYACPHCQEVRSEIYYAPELEAVK